MVLEREKALAWLLLHTRILLFCLAPHAQAELPVVDLNRVVALYGKPDKIDSTEYDRPRPPIVTKFLEYNKARVRIVLIADAPMGAPPPYKQWRFVGVQDIKTNQPLSGEEAKRRLGK